MKGKTNQPLSILIDTDMATEPEIIALVENGHEIGYLPMFYDMVLSRRAWRYDPKYVGISLKAARKAKKEKETE